MINENIKLPKFPDDFFQFGKSLSSSCVSDEEINSWIKEGIEELEDNINMPIFSRSTGDTLVEVNRQYWSENQYVYNVMVAKNRYETTVLDKNNQGNFYKGNF